MPRVDHSFVLFVCFCKMDRTNRRRKELFVGFFLQGLAAYFEVCHRTGLRNILKLILLPS